MLSADRLSTITTATASPSCHPCEHHLWASKHIWCPRRLSLGKPQQFRRIPTVATFQTQNSHQGGLWQIILYLRAVFNIFQLHKKSAEIPLDVDCVFVFLCVFPRLCVCVCVRATIVWECFATSVAPPPLLNPLNAPSRGASAWKSRRYCYRRLSSHKYVQEHTNTMSRR